MPEAVAARQLWPQRGRELDPDHLAGKQATVYLDPRLQDGGRGGDPRRGVGRRREAAVRGCPDLLAMYTTKYEGAVVRQTNVKVATQYAGDTLLKPDQEYDLDQLLGPRTRERGWSVPVGSLTSGTDLQDSILGGAIAQVATTVFNAAFEAGLGITERHNTSIYIAHYPAGREAAVTAGSKNLRFVNDTAHDIWIYGQSDGITTTFRIYGTDDGRKVQSSKGEFYNIIPKTAVTVEDEGLSQGRDGDRQRRPGRAHAGGAPHRHHARRDGPSRRRLHERLGDDPGGDPGGHRDQVT